MAIIISLTLFCTCLSRTHFISRGISFNIDKTLISIATTGSASYFFVLLKVPFCRKSLRCSSLLAMLALADVTTMMASPHLLCSALFLLFPSRCGCGCGCGCGCHRLFSSGALQGVRTNSVYINGQVGVRVGGWMLGGRVVGGCVKGRCAGKGGSVSGKADGRAAGTVRRSRSRTFRLYCAL